MEIGYRNKQLRQLCLLHRVAETRLGAQCAAKLRIRLAALEAARSVVDLVAGNPHPLKGDRAGKFALNLTGGVRLVFKPANEPCPVLTTGDIDWARVTAVCIEFIGDYHD